MQDFKSGTANKLVVQAIEDQIEGLKETRKILNQTQTASQNIADNLGVKVTGAISDIVSAIPGLSRFSGPFKNAAETARVVAAKTGSSMQALAAGGASLAKAATAALPLLILNTLVKTFSFLDTKSGEVAKNLGISNTEALQLAEELATAEEFSGKLFLNSENLLDAQVQLSQTLGTNVQLNSQLLKSQVELTKQAGLSVEAATTLGTLSLATGNTTEDITKNFLGQAQALNIQEGISLNNKQLLEGINKVSKGTLATFASQPKELAKAVFQAKALGLEIEQVEKIADGLLDIESSLAAEFEAEVISGRQLNLERARFAALTNDIAGVGREIAAQGITQEKFAGATRIEQEALAKAVGLSRDELGEALILQEGIAAAGVEDEAAARKKFERLKAQVGEAEAIKQLGDTELARQLASVSAQEKFTQVTNQLRDAFVSIAGPLLQIINPIIDILAPALEGISSFIGYIVDGFKAIAPALKVVAIALSPIIALFGLLAISSIVSSAYAALGGLPVVGPALALAAIGFGVNKFKAAKQEVKDGIASPARGPFTVTDNFGATAITSRGDGIAVSPNITREDRNTSGTVTLSDAQIQKIANAVAAGASRANITLDKDRVASRLPTPLLMQPPQV